MSRRHDQVSELAVILHPIGAVGRTTGYNMDLFLLSVIVAALLFALPIVRRRISFGSSTRSGIAREHIAMAREGAEQTRITTPMKQFLVVVLPDGRVIGPTLRSSI